MKRTNTLPRRVMACWCLLAALLLHAPIAGVAWMATSGNCCTDGMCSITGHHPSKAASNNMTDMHCAHDMADMNSCAMDCCNKPEKQVLRAAIFTMPASTVEPGPQMVDFDLTILQTYELKQLAVPLSPPPRS